MVPELTTGRLLLRGWRDDDLDALSALDSDPEVMRYIGDGSPLDRARTAEFLDRMRTRWDENGYGLFAVEERGTPGLAGWCGLNPPVFLPEVMPVVEIGWRFARDRWGRGLATEAARAVLRFAFAPRGEGAGLERVVSIRHVDNERSARVMEKLGLAFERRTTVPGNGRPVIVTELKRADWGG